MLRKPQPRPRRDQKKLDRRGALSVDRQKWLFDHPPVSWCEVYEWVENVAGIPRSHWRATYYAEQWNVASKIAAEKGYKGGLLRVTPHRSIYPSPHHPAPVGGAEYEEHRSTS